MRKKLFVLGLLFVAVCLPFRVYASSKTYNTLGLKEVLAEEEIEESFDNYNPNSDAINIYMFRGNGCGFCRAFLEFLNNNTDEYGKYFNLVSYEVWYDSDNASLMEDVAAYLDEEVTGVPYIIIGNTTFNGYSEVSDDAIKKAIKDLYKIKKNKRYDIITEMEKNPNKKEKTEFSSDTMALIYPLICIVISTIIIITYINLKFKELYLKLYIIDDKKKKKDKE